MKSKVRLGFELAYLGITIQVVCLYSTATGSMYVRIYAGVYIYLKIWTKMSMNIRNKKKNLLG